MKPLIVAFSTEYFPYIGGAEVALRQIATRLKSEYDFIIITSSGPRIPPALEQVEEGWIYRLGPGTALDKWLMLINGQRSIDQILDQHQDARPVILWGMDITQGSLLASYTNRRHPHFPFILTVQYGGSLERLQQARLGLIQRSFRAMLSRADHVITISRYLEELTQTFNYSGPLNIIPNGVDLDLFHNPDPTEQSGAPQIISVSRLVEKNGLDTLLRSVAILKSTGFDVQCPIVGEGPLRSELEILARQLGIQDRIEFIGNIPHNEVPSYLWRASLFVRPSRSEGMGNVFLEALAAGLPIIGTRVGGIPDIIQDGETGLLADVDDAEDLASKIRELLTNAGLSHKIVSKGIRMIQDRFTWDGIAESYQMIFNQWVSLHS